jgi:DNA-binding IclR family transcriptional regulator
VKLNKVDEAIVKTLKAEGKELSLQELTEKTGLPSKKIFRSLKKLFEHEMVDTKARKYKLLKEKPSDGKDEEAAEPEKD